MLEGVRKAHSAGDEPAPAMSEERARELGIEGF